jgi:hypothetical protein
MSKTVEYKVLGIKTPAGKRIYDAAVRKAISYEDKRDAANTKRDQERFDKLRMKVLSEGLKQALALNPKAKVVNPT